MAKLNDDKFDPFADTTPPRADAAGNGQGGEETGQEPPIDPPERPRQGGRPRAPKSAEVPAEMDKGRRLRWRTTLQNAALKLAADRARLDESEQAWADTIAEARALGVPANMLLAAAAYADVELPE